MAFGGASRYTAEEHLKMSISGMEVLVVSGDIAKMQADGVVVGDDSRLSGNGGIASAIALAGGSAYTTEKQIMITKHVPQRFHRPSHQSSVFWCRAGPSLPYRHVYHAVLPEVYGLHVKDKWKNSITALYAEVFKEADSWNREQSIVIPVLGSGSGRGNLDDTTWAALHGIRQHPSVNLKKIVIIERDTYKAKRIAAVCQRWIENQRTQHRNSCVFISTLTSGKRDNHTSGFPCGSSPLNRYSSDEASRSQPPSHSSPGGALPGGGNSGGTSSSSTWSSPSLLGSGSSASGFNWREPRKEQMEKEQDRGRYNYHMEGVARKVEERKRSSKDPSAYHTSTMTAEYTHDHSGKTMSYADAARPNRGPTSTRRHETSHPDNRHIMPMEVEEAPSHFSEPRRAASALMGLMESASPPLEKKKPASSSLVIQYLDNDDESSEEEAPSTQINSQKPEKPELPASESSSQPVLRRSQSEESSRFPDSLGVASSDKDRLTSSCSATNPGFTFPEPGTRPSQLREPSSHKNRGSHDRFHSSQSSEEKNRETNSSAVAVRAPSGRTPTPREQRSLAKTVGAARLGISELSSPGEWRRKTGNMPEGKMLVNSNTRMNLEGYANCGVLVIEYSFPNGVQTSEHPNPGQPYKGTFRRAFLPNNEEGQQVLKLLREAFDRKLTFRIVAGAEGEGTVEFADTPHKTRPKGGPPEGYPDNAYLGKVRDLLRDNYGIQ